MDAFATGWESRPLYRDGDEGKLFRLTAIQQPDKFLVFYRKLLEYLSGNPQGPRQVHFFLAGVQLPPENTPRRVLWNVTDTIHASLQKHTISDLMQGTEAPPYITAVCGTTLRPNALLEQPMLQRPEVQRLCPGIGFVAVSAAESDMLGDRGLIEVGYANPAEQWFTQQGINVSDCQKTAATNRTGTPRTFTTVNANGYL